MENQNNGQTSLGAKVFGEDQFARRNSTKIQKEILRVI